MPKDNTYKGRVEAKETANVEIIATKEDIKIEIIERLQEGENTSQNIIGTGVRNPKSRSAIKGAKPKLCN